ncbi:MAG: valine--tRNA ligase [Proteobacteria bacterium]|nr:valine--tRNA ligase [Pseudomonadota bacterium]MBU4469445.1 valine--tRNA ligase [Pseudomonadota bacterium]MCG2752346.1 valine--tRNA ligase [Desulfobacteraceae bacterium]
MSSDLLDKGYEPHDVEARWYAYWESNKMFSATPDSNAKGFAIVIPPPNVTGVLHMGHALNITLQDILCRYRRLRGDAVLWIPGTDHAGIATQNVVEKKLAAEGITRHEMGREKFIESVWKWREQYGSAIINQLKRLGASCDWDRERFTMDEGLSIAVKKVFVQLYDEGLIYQGRYITNWCPRCRTALADLEVDHEDHNGHLYHILYPFAAGEGGIVVATTRPETMLGDTAVAVNPDDPRYQNLASEAVILPLMEREIPIIKDSYVDMAFGSGGLKVTPAHDPNDFELGKRHDLESIKVIGDDGVMTEAAGRFKGQDRFSCREAVVKALKQKGLMIKIDPHQHSVGHCYRCRTTIEPNLSKQWFVATKTLAQKAMDAVNNNETRIIPEMWTKTYFEWMENIRDWCISRQIWWGHQIPAWTCTDCNEIAVATEAPDACPSCGSKNLVQETDVLDTWFSSALWPFSTMGWPEKTPLLKKFYPTAVLVTAFDILFFWVARMMMMGTHFMKQVPFAEVYIHALVRDEEGKKMSKSVGNVIDPLTIIDQYGTDAFRFTLAAFAAQGRDIRMSEKRVEGYRHFINKLWNAARFSFMHLKSGDEDSKPNPSSLPDQWILSRLHTTVESVSRALDLYRFNEAAGALYQFVWHEFCDWYLEAIKPSLYGHLGEEHKESTLKTLWHALRETLILLHPFIPFVTEEIWQKLPGTKGSVSQMSFLLDRPETFTGMKNGKAEAEMTLLVQAITGIRNIRGEMNVSPSMGLRVVIQSSEENLREVLEKEKDMITHLARLDAISITVPGEKPKSSALAVIDGATVFASLEGIIDVEKEISRLEKELDKISKEMIQFSKKLSNDDFLKKAPLDVVEKVKEKQALLLEKQEKVQVNIDKIKSI